jgi:GSH-dependent disulfide-bond oxidoreductase
MIDLHFTSGPNARKVAIMLEELEWPYRVITYDIGKGDMLTEAFRELNPNGRVPVLVDDEPIGGGTEPIVVWESAACLQYLADKSGQFLPAQPKARYATLQWLAWQIASLGPYHGQAAHFTRYAPEPIDPYARQRFRLEGERLMFVADRHLGENAYFAGDEYTIADMAVWPWLNVSWNTQYDRPLDSFEHLNRWFEEVKARPAVQRVIAGELDEWMHRTDHVRIPPERFSNAYGDNFHAFHRKPV